MKREEVKGNANKSYPICVVMDKIYLHKNNKALSVWCTSHEECTKVRNKTLCING